MLLRVFLTRSLLLAATNVAFGAEAIAADTGRNPGISARELRDLHPVVQERVRHLLGSSRARAWASSDLARDRGYAPMVRRALAEAHLPAWLAAIPLIESGYRNVGVVDARGAPAGLWQFVPETARNMGLRVDGGTDQRLDPEAATAAAVRLLSRLHDDHDGDWVLALSAYNMGSGSVRAVISRTGGRMSGWEMLSAGHLPGYAAEVAAAAWIAEHGER